jgi:hypothetical protein
MKGSRIDTAATPPKPGSIPKTMPTIMPGEQGSEPHRVEQGVERDERVVDHRGSLTGGPSEGRGPAIAGPRSSLDQKFTPYFSLRRLRR